MAQVEHYTTDQRHPNTDENHPSLSSVPSLPGPELDSKHYQHDQDLSEPPLFSPPITNTTFDDTSFDRREDLSIGSIQSHSSLAEFNDQSHEDHSASINEPRTPESIAPSLDYVPVITGESDALSVDHVSQPPEIISKAQAHQADQEEETAEEHVDDQALASASEETVPQPKSLESTEAEPKLISSSFKEKSQLEVDQPPVNPEQALAPREIPLPASRVASRSNNLGSINNTAPMSLDDWLDVSRTEFQFAIGFFAIPWSSLVILTRSINMFWTLIFSQPLVHPITGILLSIIAPSLLYTSLVVLIISSAAHIDW